MDQSPPEQPPAPEPAPPTDSAPKSQPATRRDSRAESRLRTLVDRHEAGDELVAWSRSWISREVPLHRLLAARTLDFAVVTPRFLLLFSTGFFTRRPRRLVYDVRLDEIVVSRVAVARGGRLRISSPNAKALRIELRATERAEAFAAAVIARTHAEPS